MVPTILVILALLVLYWFTLRRWFARWGTTRDELTRVMAGDTGIADPTHSATQAVTVNAPPESIWPWLVQIGYQRGGLYSYDWLDRLFGFFGSSERRAHHSRVSAPRRGRQDFPRDSCRTNRESLRTVSHARSIQQGVRL